MKRHYLRCTGCLEVMAVDAEALALEWRNGCRALAYRCGICGSQFEEMGYVRPGDEGTRLLADRVRCACDERCTSARGPLCSCGCGGKNHGAGMLAYITYMVETGEQRPVLTPRTAADLDKARQRFAEFTARYAPLTEERRSIEGRRAAGEFLPRPLWDRMVTLQRVLREARKAKTHGSRMKKLQALTDPASVAAALAFAAVHGGGR